MAFGSGGSGPAGRLILSSLSFVSPRTTHERSMFSPAAPPQEPARYFSQHFRKGGLSVRKLIYEGFLIEIVSHRLRRIPV